MRARRSDQATVTSRRQFIQSSATLAAGAAAATGILSQPVHAAGSDQLKVGLIGCGGRGTGAAAQALRADSNVRLTALGDAFADRLETCLEKLAQEADVAGKIDVPPERRFTGFEAYQQVIDSGVDVVLLCAPPHFRPLHLRAAVDAGKHIFAEKPVAVDAPGVRAVIETCEAARQKNLSVVSGLCLRYSRGFAAAIGKIHDGEIGTVHTLQANDFRGPIWVKPRQPDWTDMHWQMRNWYYFTWLSGDFNVEQHVHFLDICSWVMRGEYPIRAVGSGGRQVRTGAEFGNIYDHHSVIYEYASGARCFSHCRQQAGCHNDMSAFATGTKGSAELREGRLMISNETQWRYRDSNGPDNFYQTEHDQLFAGIRNGTPINNGEYMAKSTLLAIMGRMATYTGQAITWEQALQSREDLSPPQYAWGEIATPQVALPGITKFA